MITREEAEKIGFDDLKDFRTPLSLRFNTDDFSIYLDDEALRLWEWERDEGIDISHLNAEQVKTLISLLTKPK